MRNNWAVWAVLLLGCASSGMPTSIKPTVTDSEPVVEPTGTPTAAESEPGEATAMDPKKEQNELLASLEELQRLKDWPGFIAAVRRISELDQDTRKRSKYIDLIGVIYRDELTDVGSARKAFEEALALDPENAHSKRALEAL